VPVRPKVKGRPRFGRHGAYTDKATKEYEEAIGLAYSAAGGPKFSGNLRLTVTFSRDKIVCAIREVEQKSGVRGDVDNYVKSLMDGLNGVAYDDDGQVVDLRAFKR